MQIIQQLHVINSYRFFESQMYKQESLEKIYDFFQVLIFYCNITISSQKYCNCICIDMMSSIFIIIHTAVVTVSVSPFIWLKNIQW